MPKGSPKFSKLVKDGINNVYAEEFQSFIKKAICTRDKRGNPCYLVTIPIQVAKNMQLKKEDVILVAIKKATIQDVNNYKTIKHPLNLFSTT